MFLYFMILSMVLFIFSTYLIIDFLFKSLTVCFKDLDYHSLKFGSFLFRLFRTRKVGCFVYTRTRVLHYLYFILYLWPLVYI